MISATVGLPVPLCGCHRPAGSYCLSHPRSQQVRPPFSLSFIYLFILFFLFFNPLAFFLSSFLFPFPPPPFLFLYFYFFFVFYFQRFPRRRAPARSPVMIGPELSKERPLANNRRSVRRVRPTRRGRRAGGREKIEGRGRGKKIERERGREREE